MDKIGWPRAQSLPMYAVGGMQGRHKHPEKAARGWKQSRSGSNSEGGSCETRVSTGRGRCQSRCPKPLEPLANQCAGTPRQAWPFAFRVAFTAEPALTRRSPISIFGSKGEDKTNDRPTRFISFSDLDSFRPYLRNPNACWPMVCGQAAKEFSYRNLAPKARRWDCHRRFPCWLRLISRVPR